MHYIRYIFFIVLVANYFRITVTTHQDMQIYIIPACTPYLSHYHYPTPLSPPT